MQINKITTGFVVQTFAEKEDGTFVCENQTFVASDQVDVEDLEGNPIEVTPEIEKAYFNFEMVQPPQ